MRPISKKWQSLVSEKKNQKEIIRWNTIFLKHQSPGEGFVKIGGYKTGIKFDDLPGVIEQIEPLTRSKLKTFLGKGAFGIVFELENNHIIKLFFEGFNDKTPDSTGELELYKKLQDAQFIGTATKQDPAIYSYGETSYEKVLSDSEKRWASKYGRTSPPKLKWVEMGQVIPFEMWLEITGRDPREEDFAWVADSLVTLLTKSEEHGWQDEDEEFYREKIEQEMESNSTLTKQEWESFIQMVTHIIKIHGPEKVGDLHAGNFGISMQDKKTMVAYDF